MKKVLQIASIVMVATFAAGCAHNIKIAPEMKAAAAIQKSEKSAAYYISAEEKAKVTTTPGGGGDSVSYQMAKDLEFPLYKVLSEAYQEVKHLECAGNC